MRCETIDFYVLHFDLSLFLLFDDAAELTIRPSAASLRRLHLLALKKERKKTDNPREGWEDGTPPPHRDFKERCVVR